MEKAVIVLNAVPGSECRIARSTSQRHDLLSDSVTAGPERNNTSSNHYSSPSSQNTSQSTISPIFTLTIALNESEKCTPMYSPFPYTVFTSEVMKLCYSKSIY